MWNEDNAPPSAVKTPTVVSDKDIIRGQLGAFNVPMIVVGGAAAAATAISLDAEDDAEDAQAQNALLRARVLALETASP
jgi:threonine dehydratase